MTRRQNRLVSLLVALVMIITLFPMFPAQAADSQYFTFPAFGKTQQEAVNNPVNVSVIDSFHGTFSQSVPSTLSYKVQQQVEDTSTSPSTWVDKGVPKLVPSATPVISGPSGQEFTLRNVQLFVGMNKITVYTQSGVEGVCYIYYEDAPVIYDISLNNGEKLNGSYTPYVDNGTQFFIIKTANAQAVTVNGVNASKYGPDSFALSNFNLVPGLNKLTFVAKSDTRVYTISREIIYINQPGALYNVYMQSDNTGADRVQIDGGAVVSARLPATSLPLGLKGQISIPSNENLVIDGLELTRDGNAVFALNAAQTSTALTLSAPVDDGKGHKNYSFFFDLSSVPAGGSWPISSNGVYMFKLRGYHNEVARPQIPLVSTVAFTYKDASKASIRSVQQIYGVNEADNTGGTPGVFTRSITGLPVYALLSVQNNTGGFTTTVQVQQNGNPAVTLTPGTDYEIFASDDTPGAGSRKIRINKLPYVGDMNLVFSVTDSGNTDTFTLPSVQYTPIPSIALYGIYDGDNRTNTDLPNFTGRLFNFVDPADKNTMKITINGKELHADFGTSNTNFSVINADPLAPDQLKDVLVEGANELRVEGTTQNIPVVTRYTIYYFTTDAPVISDPIPLPVPPSATASERAVDDPNHKFTLDPSTNSTYNTSEKKADVVFSVTNAEKAVIMRDGVQFMTIEFDALGVPTFPAVVGGLTITYELGVFRIQDLPLTVGTNSLVVRAIKGPITTFKPLSIVRTNPPYQVLSPKLPEERVINQNFVNVVIKADGADSVMIGKTAMNKITENGEIYFTSEVSNLKSGSNTIKYTVVRGTQSSNDQFEVFYANSDVPGAQFRASLNSNASVKVFNNKISLSFPKGTMLTPYNDVSTKIELFDKQQFLFGIADPNDGRTQRTFNHYGTVVPINSDDGNLMKTVLAVPQHYGYASSLFWVDAGFYDSTKPGYVQQNGMHPYYGVEKDYQLSPQRFNDLNVWGRTLPSYWLKPTQRGTITLKYDESIRDFASNRLSIWRYGLIGQEGYRAWEQIGGKVDPKSHTISASVDSFGYYAVFLNTFGFDDTESHDFARDDMELMFARGIMKAKDASEFGAYEPTTRGEFAQMMVKALDLPLNYDPNNYMFLDVPHSLNVSPYWDYRYIETAGQKGIVRGVGVRQFAPDDRVTREQAAVMIALAMNLKLNKDYDVAKKNLDKIFADSGQVSIYARSAIEAVYQNKLMVGRSVPNSDPKQKPVTLFDPQANITRAEAAKVVANMMRKYNRL